jgi:outer membrane protein assembly factor BamA
VRSSDARRGLAAAGLVAALLGAGGPARAATPAADSLLVRLELHGAQAVDAGRVRGTLGLPLHPDSLYAGLQRLGRLYYELGYVDATLAPEPHGSTLRLHVDEGRAARLARVLVRGADALPEAEVRARLGLRAGQPFRPAHVEARLQALLDEYAQRGYLDAEAALERLEFGADGVVLGVALSEGGRATLAEVRVQGNTASRAALVQRLARLGTPQPADGRRIHDAELLLRRSGLFAAVDTPVLYRPGGGAERVGVLLRVVETQRRHSVFGAVGLARDPRRDGAYLHGSADLALRNIYGTGRDLEVAWQRDALVGSRLEVGYRERFLLGLPLDLDVDLAQAVRDSTYTGQSLGVGVVLPLNRTLALEVGTAVDRSVFHVGQQGNALRLRHRVGLRFETLEREADGRRFGALEVRAEYARRRNDLSGAGLEDRSRVEQTLWGGRFEAGLPLWARHVLAARGEWHVIDSDEAEVPASELYAMGGTRSLRGYREEQFRGDQVAYGGVEYRVGEARAAQLYGFVDGGVLRRRRRDAAREEEAHVGYGLGLRAEVAAGRFDLSFGVGEERSLGAVKVHVSFLQRF